MLHKVRLYSEQEALAEVEAPEGASEEELAHLVLEAVDRGDARFEAIAGWLELGWEGSPHHAPARDPRSPIVREIEEMVRKGRGQAS